MAPPSLSWHRGLLCFLCLLFVMATPALPALGLLWLYDQDFARYTIGGMRHWAGLSALVGLMLVGLLYALRSPVWPLLFGVFLDGIFLLNLGFAVSMREQGTGFNDLFLSYLHLAVVFCKAGYALLAAACVLLLGCIFLALFFLWRTSREAWDGLRKKIKQRGARWHLYGLFLYVPTLVLVVCVSVINLESVESLQFYALSNFGFASQTSRQAQLAAEAFLRGPIMQARLEHEPHLRLPAKGKTMPNLVWVFAESLERRYFEDASTRPLMKELTSIRSHSVDFDNIIQAQGITNSIAGMKAALCSVTLQAVVKDRSPCFMNLLSHVGYETIHMQAADAYFASYFDGVRPNGYKNFLGHRELTPLVPTVQKNTSWGVYDEGLFELAQHRFTELASTHKPFAMSIFTADNHTPADAISPVCRRLPGMAGLRPFAQGARCTSATLSHFIKFIRAQPASKDTIIVVMSDHLHPVHDAFGSLDKRHLTFFVNYPDGRRGVNRHLGTHLDIGATVLEAMGFGAVDMEFGQSLLSHKEGFLPMATKQNKTVMSGVAYVPHLPFR